jgi:hypothetical protein
MLKRMLKSCMVVAMVGAMAAPVMAADVAATVNGRTRTWVESVAVKDGGSTMQMKADGRLGASVSATSGAWTVTAFQNMDLDSDSDNANPTIRDQKITIGNETMDITLGRFSPYGISKGMTYAAGPIYNAYWIGENVPTTDVTDHLTVSLKEIGLTAILGLNTYDAGNATDERDEMMVGVVYGKQFGAVDLAVEYLSASSKVDEYGGEVDGQYDGAKFSAMALGVDFAISETMDVALNYESNSSTSGIDGADADKNTAMELWFSMGLGDGSGVSLGYTTVSSDDGTEEKGASTIMNVAYSAKLGIATLYANYLAETVKDDDGSASDPTPVDSTTTTMAFGAEVNF